MKELKLPEIVAVGIYNAALAQKGRTVTKNRKTTMFELEAAIADGGRSYIDDTSHAISENLIIAAKPGQVRHTRTPFTCYYVHLVVTEGEIFDTLSTLPNYIESEDTSEIRKIFAEMCEHYGTGAAADEIMLHSLLLKLIYTLSKAAPSIRFHHTPKQNNRAVIEGTLRYINSNLTADLSLESLSREAKFSPIYFHKLFKASTGKTLREYVEEQRLRKAIELMLSTEMTLTQIAYECGFSSQSYFNYAFKKKMGHSPREYVKNILLQYDKSGTSF